MDDGGAGRPRAPPRPGAPRRHGFPRGCDGAGSEPCGLGRSRPNADGGLIRRAAVLAGAAGLRYTLDDGVPSVQGDLAAVGQHLPELFAATLDPRLHARYGDRAALLFQALQRLPSTRNHNPTHPQISAQRRGHSMLRRPLAPRPPPAASLAREGVRRGWSAIVRLRFTDT